MSDLQRHFSQIANQYTRLRTTDYAPISFIKKQLKKKYFSTVVEIGCGDGRYTKALLQSINGDPLFYCVDRNKDMLSTLKKNMKKEHVKIILAPAERMPFDSNSIDAIFVFNAVHHFHLFRFLRECSRCLTNDGQVYIYTRLKKQNAQNIWGKYFPHFQKKETRLFSLHSFQSTANRIPGLTVEHIQYFRFSRKERIQRLIEQAEGRHYSTFNLYTNDEFRTSIQTFIKRLRKHFKNPDQISWNDENVLFILKKAQSSPPARLDIYGKKS